MDCHYLEVRLEALAEGTLADVERQACQSHLETCPACSEILELARLGERGAGAAPPDLASTVLARTTGGACGRAESLLADGLDGTVSPTDRELLDGHTVVCESCRSLGVVMAGLGVDLPRLAVLRPDEKLVDDVLKRTLPVNVQLRRWWSRTWPNLVRRPRFASEAAFIGLIVLVVVFATPGSPLEAVPAKALAVAQDPKLPRIEIPAVDLEGRLDETAQAIRESKSGQTAADWKAAGEQAADRAKAFLGGVKADLGTFWDEAASLLTRTDQEPSSEPETTIEETS